jgi:hypothetical protein
VYPWRSVIKEKQKTERMELPSTRAARIWARSSMLKRFTYIVDATARAYAKRKVTLPISVSKVRPLVYSSAIKRNSLEKVKRARIVLVVATNAMYSQAETK